MMKSLYTCALFLAIFCVVHSATILGDNAIQKEAIVKCIKKTGVQDMPDASKPNLSQNEKCFISCRLIEGGAMNADGTFNAVFFNYYISNLKGGSLELKNKLMDLVDECTKTGLAEKDVCQHAVTAVNCVSNKIANHFKYSGWRRNGRPEVNDKCLKKIGLTNAPNQGWNLTHPEKCFRSCVLTESGSMNADGTFNEVFITETLYDIPPSKMTEENKAKVRQAYVDCIKTGFQDKDMCEHGTLASKCVIDTFKTINFN